MWLGAGREHLDSKIDHAVGMVLKKKVGDAVSSGEILCVLEYNDGTRVQEAITRIQQAYVIGDSPPEKTPLIKQVIRG